MSLRIVIADDFEDQLEMLGLLLTSRGHVVVGAASSGRELVQVVFAATPDLVITDVLMPGDLDGIDAAQAIWRKAPVPVVLVSGTHNKELAARAEAECVTQYLTKPFTSEALETYIHLAMARFAQFQALRREADDLRQSLEARKVVERAKRALMTRGGLDEETAFARLQQEAKRERIKLVEAARRVLFSERLLRPGE